MLHFIKLIRYPNLLIIVLTQYLFRYAIMIPILNIENIKPAFSDVDFALLVFSTILIAAAGYIINDYFDMRTDRINKPHKMIIGKYFSRRHCLSHNLYK